MARQVKKTEGRKQGGEKRKKIARKGEKTEKIQKDEKAMENMGW